MKADVLIVGCGVAGLYCALNLPREKNVVVVTKNKAPKSGVLARDHSVLEHPGALAFADM